MAHSAASFTWRPSDYDYGFGKLEQAASLAVSAAMFASFLVVCALAIHRIYHPVSVQNIGFGLALGILSVMGNVCLWVHNRNLAYIDSSPILESQWRLFRAKSVAAIIVVFSLFVALVGSGSVIALYSDPVGSLLLGGLLLHSALKLSSTSMDDLLDRSVEEALRLVIMRILVIHQEKYSGLTNVRSRRVGGKIHIEITLDFLGTLVFSDVAAAMHSIRTDIHSAIPGSEVVIVANAT